MDIFKHVGTEIDYVRKHTSQLVCACSENAARDVVLRGSLARVNTLKWLTQIGLREREPTVLVSRPQRWHRVILKPGKEGV